MGNNIFKEEIKKINNINNEYINLYAVEDYLDYDDIYKKICKLIPQKLEFRLKDLFKYSDYKLYDASFRELMEKFNKYKSYIDIHNKKILKDEIFNFKNICGLVEGRELDEQQIDAIVRKNNNQLVIAGAGSGKTTTIVGKVKYLLGTKKYESKDILLLSFTNASASEMKERIKKETNEDLDVMTFHKLGLEIIKKSIGKNVNVFDKDLYQFIKKVINKNMEDNTYFNKLVYFMGTARFDVKDDFDFSSENEYQEYLQTNKPTTLKGEIVKSYGELEIANYLFENSIEYNYEQDYEINTTDDEYQQYRPDFYLPEYKIYIEYFGIDENNKVAPYFKGKNGKSASETYIDSIKWKEEIHKENNTIMIETFYYENKQGCLISNLESKLKKHNVNIKHRSNGEMWDIINQNNNGLLNEICRVFETIINLIKSNNYTVDYLYSLSDIQY